jgi:hypothetical protein
MYLIIFLLYLRIRSLLEKALGTEEAPTTGSCREKAA